MIEAAKMTAQYPQQRSDVRVCRVEEEMIVFDRRCGLIHQLNPTARYIWERCDGTATVADIAQHLAEAFGVDPQTAAADVVALMEQLHTLELLAPQDSGVRPVECEL